MWYILIKVKIFDVVCIFVAPFYATNAVFLPIHGGTFCSFYLKEEIEKQGLEKYRNGDYTLGQLNVYGQRISIMVELPRKNGDGRVSFITGWMVKPNGLIQLITPFGGK